MGEEPGRHGGHVRLGAPLDLSEVRNVLGISVERADKLLERRLARGIDVAQIHAGERLRRVLCRKRERPAGVELQGQRAKGVCYMTTEKKLHNRTHVEVAVHDVTERAERGGVDEEGWHEVNLAGRVRVLRELSLPAGWGVCSAEGARLPGERRDERLSADLELGGPAGERVGQGADGGSIISGLAWEGAGGMMSSVSRRLVRICKRLSSMRTSCRTRRRA